VFGIFFLFLIANIVLVIWALVDAIKVPDDSMFKAGTEAHLGAGDPVRRFRRGDHLSRGRAPHAGGLAIRFRLLDGSGSAAAAPGALG
jgi:hypothetical protein